MHEGQSVELGQEEGPHPEKLSQIAGDTSDKAAEKEWSDK